MTNETFGSIYCIFILLNLFYNTNQINYKSFKMFTPLEDIKLETIDFKWIQETTKISHLKRAIKLIEMDGNFFADLK